MLQLNNYIILRGQYVKIKELYSEDLQVEAQDRTLLNVSYNDIRFIELKSDVLLKVTDCEKPVFKLLSEKSFEFHKRQDWDINLRGKHFYLRGYLYDKTSIWNLINTFTVHYFHQVQNIVSILNPEVWFSL